MSTLSHFGIAENLRPGDENLRHLTVSSKFKNQIVFLVAVLHGEIPYVGRHEGLHRPTDATQQIRLETKQFHGEQYIGKVVSVILSQWLNVS